MSLNRNYWLMILMLVCSFSASAVNTAIQIFDTDEPLRLNTTARLLFEPDGQRYSLEEVLERRTQFTWPFSSNPNYGFSESGLWLYNRFSNVSEASEFVFDIGFAQNDTVEFYLVERDKILASAITGKKHSGSVYRFPTMEATLPYATEVELFVRVESLRQRLVVPLDVQAKNSHTIMTSLDYTLWGVFYGGILILMFYNLMLFLGTKEPSLIAYIVYLSTVLFWQFIWGGHSQIFFSGDAGQWLNDHTGLIFLLVGIGAGVFTKTFLNTHETAPRMHRIYKPLFVILVALIPVSVFNEVPAFWQNLLVYTASMLSICIYLLSGFESYLNQFKPARYFIFAWSLLLTCALVGLLGLVGLLPSNFITTYCFQFGVFFEAALFSIALIEKSRHQLENEVLEATNDLINNLEIIEEQNARLDIARKDAVNSNRVKSQFLANMSHEIRTPLNAILGFSRELAKSKLPPQQQEHVQIINSSASNLLVIVNDVLDFSKIEAGKLQIAQEAFSPNELLEEIIFVNAKSAQKKHLSFIYHPCALPEKLIGDPARIKQVLTNIISNAIKFTNSGTITMTVRATEIADELIRLHVEVEDTGIGIDPEQKEKLFKAFSQLDDALTRTYQGTGLGLVICKQLMHLMRGDIGFRSAHGQGSCFYISLDCMRLSRHVDIAPIEAWQEKSVLLFDSHPERRRSRSTLFKQVGMQLTSVDSLEFLAQQYMQYDYLFADLTGLSNRRLARFKQIAELLSVEHKILISHDAQSTFGADIEACFDRKMEPPILYSQLQSFHQEEEQDDKQIWRQHLKKLPAVKILAVDDMEINLRLLRTWLQESPIALSLSFSGEEAVRMCETEEYDLILMDVQMPSMDGLEATRLIRKTRLNQGTPIIAVTAHAFKEEKERLLASGMDDYLPKPLEILELTNQIQRWCSVPDYEASYLEDTDWQLALSRANQDEAIAADMFREFIKQLPGVLEAVKISSEKQDWTELQHTVHRLHGASCYTGVPKLQRMCADVESELKAKQIHEVQTLLPAFIEAIETLLADNISMTAAE